MKHLVLLFTVVLATAAQAASIDVVRSNFTAYYTAAGADRTSLRMRDALSALESAARTYAAPGYLLSNGAWADINYDDTPDGSWSPWDHFRRLMIMAKAYRTPGQALYNDPLLRVQIESALAYVPAFYGPYTLPLGNWWFWSLGAPLDLGPTLVLMRGDINQRVYDDCLRTLSIHIGPSPTARALVGPVPTGQNLVWSAYTHLCLALLRDDTAMLAQVRDAMASVCTTTTGDGIQSDGSFHQHGPQLYTGGYGGSFANDVARYALLTRGSEFAIPPAALSTFSDYLAEGIAWSLHGNYFDVSVVGREVARPSTSGFNGIAALLQASQVPSPRQSEIQAAAAQMLRTWNGSFPAELAALANVAAMAGWPSGHRHYFQSDYTIHRRPGWFASVKMFSSRTKSGESTNDENLLGSRQSDGRFYLVSNGDEYFGHDIWPALDWTRLPGITVEQKPETANSEYGLGTRDFAGGTGDGRNGVSAMDYAPLNSSVTAKKSWFFFDDTIVFLTNSINSASPNRVETIIDQRPTAFPTIREGNWAVAGNIGYWFYGTLPRIEQIARSGTWSALGGSTDSTPHTATFTTLWIDHGVTPVNAKAAYAVVMETTAAAMRSFVPPAIVANDATASAVRNGSAIGIVFWKPGTVAGIRSDAPAVIYVTPSDFYAADPTNGTGTFTITLSGQTITVPRNAGRTFHASLKPPRRRAVR